MKDFVMMNGVRVTFPDGIATLNGIELNRRSFYLLTQDIGEILRFNRQEEEFYADSPWRRPEPDMSPTGRKAQGKMSRPHCIRPRSA